MPSPSPTPAYETTLAEILTALAIAQPTAASGETVSTLPPPSCALCRLVARSVERALKAFFAEFVNDPGAREALRRARGFCTQHTILLAALGDSLAIAILYADLADQTRMRWQSESSLSARWKRGLGKTKGDLAPCPACTATAEATERYAGALAAGLAQETVWQALEASPGLCVAHIEEVAVRATPTAAIRLRKQADERLATLQAELEEIIRKNDYRLRGEAWGPEKDAWLRALVFLTRPLR